MLSTATCSSGMALQQSTVDAESNEARGISRRIEVERRVELGCAMIVQLGQRIWQAASWLTKELDGINESDSSQRTVMKQGEKADSG
jgi:hypothetical protein